MKAHFRPLLLITVGALFGAVFAYVSTADFTLHLDRQVHPLHCSLVPGAGPAEEDAAAGCRAAMVSPYSSFFRRAMWGGIPVSLLALGTFAFLFAFSLTLLIAPPRETRRPIGFLVLAAALPVVTSVVYFILALTSVGQLCKVCVGIYLSSTLIAGGVAWLLRSVRREGPLGPHFRPAGWWVAWAFELWFLLAIPVAIYAFSMPDYGRAITSCGRLPRPADPHHALVALRTERPRRHAILVVDPLCPACRAFHGRLEGMGDLEDLDADMLLFPLDSTCNWMLDRPLHPGACVMSRAVLCAGDRAREVLEYSYDNQEELTDLARHDQAALQRKVGEKFPDLVACMDARQTQRRLETGLQWAVDNRLPVLTPQLYIEGRRLCDEDTDLGLEYAMKRMLGTSSSRSGADPTRRTP